MSPIHDEARDETDPQDCDHADLDDHATCLTCGRECYEDLAAAAYDRAKDARYE